MRIAFFAKGMLAHGTGGMESYVENLCRELTARGHLVHVVTTRQPSGATVEERPGIRVRYLTEAPPRLLGGAMIWLLYPALLWRLGLDADDLELWRSMKGSR